MVLVLKVFFSSGVSWAGSGSTNLCSRAINTHHVRRIDVQGADLARSACRTRIYLVRVAGDQKGARYRMLKT